MSTSRRVLPFRRSPGRDYPVIVRAEGSYLWDVNGKRYLDAASGALVTNIGHGRRDIANVAAKQMQEVDFVHGSQFISRPFEDLTEALEPFTPTGSWRFFATSGGSEATESAIKLARQYHYERGEPARTIIVSREIGYHGASLGALAASGLGGRRTMYEPLLNENAFRKLPAPDPDEDAEIAAARFQQLLDDVGAMNVAALMLEPVIGAAAPGLAPQAGTYEALKEICDRNGILLLFDEVMTGLGRCGRNLALEHWTAIPDVIVLGKGLGAGYAPLAGILVAEDITRAIQAGSGSFTHGYTYAGHPVSLAVGSRVLKIVKDERLVETAEANGRALLNDLRSMADGHPEVKTVRGYGLLLGITLENPDNGEPFQRPGFAYAVNAAALEAGLNIYPGTGSAGAGRGDHLLIGPPLNVSAAEISELVEKLDAALVKARLRLPEFL